MSIIRQFEDNLLFLPKRMLRAALVDKTKFITIGVNKYRNSDYFYPKNSLITQMTITIMTKATTTYSAIKPIVSNMSNIRKSVAKIQHTRHIRRAIAAMLITYDKHPLIVV